MKPSGHESAAPGAPRTVAGRALPYLCAAAAAILGYILCINVFHLADKQIKVLMTGGLAICGLYAAIYGKSVSRLTAAILAAGFVLRIGYMLYTPYYIRAHDVASLNDPGHLSYIYNLFEHARLPQTNQYEFYQPPLQHIAQAAVVKAFSWFQPEKDFLAVVDASKLVPCFASCAVLVVSRRLCEALNLSDRAIAIAMAVLAFQPTFYVLSASINNDALTLLFFMTAVLYTVRWYHSQSIRHMLCIAVSMGLAMMTKLSGGTVLLFTAPVILIVLIKALKQHAAKKLWPQFAVFALVSAPLALWYPIRNYLLFGQPLNYIVNIGTDSPIYCGDRNIVERFLSLPLNELLSSVYCRPTEDCNIWIYTLKCSVFGEYTFKQPETLAAVLLLANLALILLSLAAMVYVLARGKDMDGLARFGMAGIWAAQLAAFVVFNGKYPFGCTMDFRYIMPTAIIGAIYIGLLLDRAGDKPAKWLYGPGVVAVCIFSAASAVFYVL